MFVIILIFQEDCVYCDLVMFYKLVDGSAMSLKSITVLTFMIIGLCLSV
jgi:hypothetical protein